MPAQALTLTLILVLQKASWRAPRRWQAAQPEAVAMTGWGAARTAQQPGPAAHQTPLWTTCWAPSAVQVLPPVLKISVQPLAATSPSCAMSRSPQALQGERLALAPLR